MTMATSTLRDLCIDCTDQHRVARFWAAVLGYTVRPADEGDTADDSVALDPPPGGLRIWCNKVPEPKVVKNRMHVDINMPDDRELGRLQELGASVLREVRDPGTNQLWWTIMADPEGNEFCAFAPKH